MDSIKDLMQAKADELDVDAKRDEIAIIQEVIARHFPHGATVQKIFDDGGVFVLVESALLASELRLQSQKLIDQMNSSLKSRQVLRLTTKVA